MSLLDDIAGATHDAKDPAIIAWPQATVDALVAEAAPWIDAAAMADSNRPFMGLVRVVDPRVERFRIIERAEAEDYLRDAVSAGALKPGGAQALAATVWAWGR